MAYIYKIVNDINQKIYIGKTAFSIEKRFKEHCQDAFRQSKEKRPLYAAMRKYGIEHFKIILIEETSYPEEREMYWIKYYESFTKGYNATLGGDGKRYLDYDLIISTYQKLQNINEVAKILGVSSDSIQEILHQYNIPVLSSSQVVKNKLGKSVNMYDLSGNLLQTFESMMDASRYLIETQQTNCKITTIRTHISEVCRNKRQTAAGYKWQYAGVV